jgi:hypothetical protein
MKIKRMAELEIAGWNEIKQYAEAGKLNEILNSGDRIPITLKDGQEIELDVGRDKTGKTYFIFHDCLKDEHIMNEEWTNAGGWAATEMRRYANEDVFHLLPEELQAVIEPTKIVQIVNGERVETQDKLFCLSYTQVFGGDYCREQEPEDTQIDIFETEKDRVKMVDGETWWWWLRSAGNAYCFRGVYSGGSSNYYSAYDTYGVALGFCVESDIR